MKRTAPCDSPAPGRPTLGRRARIGIVNRGEAALRFVRAVREHNALKGTHLQAVAFFLPADESAPFVRQAHLAVPLSSAAPFREGGSRAYLDRSAVLALLAGAGCQAAWPGWGFLAEDAQFARLVEEAGMCFLGPSWQAMALLGDKIAAKALAEKVGVPVLPWSGRALDSLEKAREVARSIGYPCIVKAAATGGGRGIRAARTETELAEAFRSAGEEALRVSGEGRVFIERLVERARHLEVQTLTDRHGGTHTFGVRDCSVQRRNQKILEETPPPGLPASLLREMETSAAALIREAGYDGAATVEFLYDLDRRQYCFMEVNTRLQVEHPITEQAYAVDLVQGQIAVAMGARLPARRFRRQAVSVEARLNAEDPDAGFTPAPGRVLLLRLPAGPGLRNDCGVEQGGTVAPEFDSMIAKIIATAPTRRQALARLERGLEELQVKIDGGTTNRAFLLQLLRRDELRRGGVSTRFVEGLSSSARSSVTRRWDIALCAAAIEQYQDALARELANFRQQLATGGYPRSVTTSSGQCFSFRLPEAQGRAQIGVEVRAVGPGEYHVQAQLPGCPLFAIHYSRDATSPETALLKPLDGEEGRFRIQCGRRANTLLVEVDTVPHALELESGGLVRAPSPAVVLALAVQAGQDVDQGTVLVVLEAMKMETIVSAAEAGTVGEILVRPGEQVAAGQALLRLERTRPAGQTDGSPRDREANQEPLDSLWDPSAWPATRRPEAQLRVSEREYLACFLGYDRGEPATTTLDRLVRFGETLPESRQGLADLILRGIEIFVDVERLFLTSPVVTEQLARPAGYQELLSHFVRRQNAPGETAEREKGLPEAFIRAMRGALAWYGPASDAPPRATEEELLRLYRSHANLEEKLELARRSVFALERLPVPQRGRGHLADSLDEIALLTQLPYPSLADAAIQARYRFVDAELMDRWRAEKRRQVSRIFTILARGGMTGRGRRRMTQMLVDTGHHVLGDLVKRALAEEAVERRLALEILARRFTRDREPIEGAPLAVGPYSAYRQRSRQADQELTTILCAAREEQLPDVLGHLAEELPQQQPDGSRPVEVLLLSELGEEGQGKAAAGEEAARSLAQSLASRPLPAAWACLGVIDPRGREHFFSFCADSKGDWREDLRRRGFNPRVFRELRVQRLSAFESTPVYHSEWVRVLELKARDNPRDERLVALVEVPSARPQLDSDGRILRMVALEEVFNEAIFALRAEQARRRQRLYWNRIVVHIHAVLDATLEQMRAYGARLVGRTAELGLEKIVVYTRRPTPRGGVEEIELDFENVSGTSFTLRGRKPSTQPLEVLNAYTAKVVRARQRGTLYPYEIVRMITRSGYPLREPFPRGEFEEYDLDPDPKIAGGRPVPERGPGGNSANVVFGLITSYPEFCPQGLQRVLVLADPTADMGSLAEAECRRIIAAIDLAESRRLPLEWIPVSAGARIDLNSGTENLDWTAAALRRIIAFTQAGGEINIIVAGINIGAQSYWNAEATMLMHTRGLLIMTDDAAMLLTGKKALDYSGSVSAEDNVGIGGAERIMSPNGQAQVRVRDLHEAYTALFQHYELTWRRPGQACPARVASADPPERDVGREPYNDNLGQGFSTIADIFSAELNPERKKPFDMRQLMAALADRDSPVFERWGEMRDAEVAVVWETRLGGFPVGLIGIESRPLARIGEIPHDGPESWSGATLFPLSSKKIARAINVFSGFLPLVILANLSGFDGSPESLRKLQLEYGAEIGRAVVNFRGPILFVVTARYHGGAYVVFSKSLNENLHVAALEGAYASVIGGAPAAAVVFPGLVRKEADADPRVVEARGQLQAKVGVTRKQFDELFAAVLDEKQAELARRFDRIHSVQRAKEVGSVDAIVALDRLRAHLVDRLAAAASLVAEARS